MAMQFGKATLETRNASLCTSFTFSNRLCYRMIKHQAEHAKAGGAQQAAASPRRRRSGAVRGTAAVAQPLLSLGAAEERLRRRPGPVGKERRREKREKFRKGREGAAQGGEPAKLRGAGEGIRC